MSDAQQFECPYCGSDNIKGHVTDHYSNVPLSPDGHYGPDGDHCGSDVDDVRCADCGQPVEIKSWDPPELVRVIKEGGA